MLVSAPGSLAGTGAASPANIRLKRDQKPVCGGAGGGGAGEAAIGAEVVGMSGATAAASCGGLRSWTPGSVTSGEVGMR